MKRPVRWIFLFCIALAMSLALGQSFSATAHAAEYSCSTSVSPGSNLTYTTDPTVPASLQPGSIVTVDFSVRGVTDLRSQYSMLWLSVCNEESNGVLSCPGMSDILGQHEWRDIPIDMSDVGVKTAMARLSTAELDTNGSRYKVTLMGQTIDGQRKQLCPAKDDAIHITKVDTQEELNEARGDLDEFQYCDQIADPVEKGKCQTCLGDVNSETTEKLYTAFGCIRIDNEGLAGDVIRLMIGISGTVALLTILVAAFILSVSQGEMKHVKEAKDLITAAVSGLFFIIFSIIILEFVGVTILRIPGL